MLWASQYLTETLGTITNDGWRVLLWHDVHNLFHNLSLSHHFSKKNDVQAWTLLSKTTRICTRHPDRLYNRAINNLESLIYHKCGVRSVSQLESLTYYNCGVSSVSQLQSLIYYNCGVSSGSQLESLIYYNCGVRSVSQLESLIYYNCGVRSGKG